MLQPEVELEREQAKNPELKQLLKAIGCTRYSADHGILHMQSWFVFVYPIVTGVSSYIILLNSMLQK